MQMPKRKGRHTVLSVKCLASDLSSPSGRGKGGGGAFNRYILYILYHHAGNTNVNNGPHTCIICMAHVKVHSTDTHYEGSQQHDGAEMGCVT